MSKIPIIVLVVLAGFTACEPRPRRFDDPHCVEAREIINELWSTWGNHDRELAKLGASGTPMRKQTVNELIASVESIFPKAPRCDLDDQRTAIHELKEYLRVDSLALPSVTRDQGNPASSSR